ncbi:hypothetical protein E4T56_gene13249 [Termitomyces sp. T112]|nr:hypothetical protein E4T56_gene13249 [Termitomyces sp. T112]
MTRLDSNSAECGVAVTDRGLRYGLGAAVLTLAFPSQNVRGMSLPSDCSRSSQEGPFFVLILLIFYALALWDRWLSLKLRAEEKMRLLRETPNAQEYRSIESTWHLTPSQSKP